MMAQILPPTPSGTNRPTGEIIDDLVRMLRNALDDNNDPNRWTAWAKASEIEDALGLARGGMKFILRRPQVKLTLVREKIGMVKMMGNFLYIWTPPSLRERKE